ncbi:hypothetical protein HH310_00580 [Actinoplanes sp. TBRC 11911]|uniref:hypothetical protein n=1 Tax=Actinoplanes sp. TBRC 11911 TaxID=2729386 RepID=UPI00145CEE59|nr:hypothetical protein [Actinoplanes sp. TBRC 11911]NMO49700.1 hypothetical protein [Actinoplanes sp. TBRC 11911]
MESARPLREVFADLTGAGSAGGDPRELLDGHGHAGLPDDLVAEAVVNFADTAPVEVAEHLAPFVTAHSAVGADETTADEGWLDLLVTAPAGDDAGDLDDIAPDGHAALDAGPGFDLDVDFGAGADAGGGTDAAHDAYPDAGSLPVTETAVTDDDGDGLDPSDLDDATTDDIGAEATLAADDFDDDDDEPDIDDIG